MPQGNSTQEMIVRASSFVVRSASAWRCVAGVCRLSTAAPLPAALTQRSGRMAQPYGVTVENAFALEWPFLNITALPVMPFLPAVRLDPCWDAAGKKNVESRCVAHAR